MASNLFSNSLNDGLFKYSFMDKPTVFNALCTLLAIDAVEPNPDNAAAIAFAKSVEPNLRPSFLTRETSFPCSLNASCSAFEVGSKCTCKRFSNTLFF